MAPDRPSPFCGIDFGTTNSAVAVAEEAARVLSLQPSCLFVTEEDAQQKLYVGDEAIRRYLAPGSEGRFIKSIKTLLPDPGFTSTRILGRQYSAENLVRPVLDKLRTEAERATGRSITRAVFGRPVEFSPDSEKDRLAEERLEQAALSAGFTDIVFAPEPVAAAWAFAAELDRPRLILVVDLGGGTSDFTVMNVSPDRAGESHRVLATGGVRVGGDDFDGHIMWHRLVSVFGYGSQYESWGKFLDVPPHIYRAICRWDRIPFLKDMRTREDLRYILSGSTDPDGIRRLMTLIDRDQGYALFRSIIVAKHALVDSDYSHIGFSQDGIIISELLERNGFEEMIRDDVDQVVETAVRTVADAGVNTSDIDACFLTGGSSLVRLIRDRFADLLGEERVATGNTLTSVAAGLALIDRSQRSAEL